MVHDRFAPQLRFHVFKQCNLNVHAQTEIFRSRQPARCSQADENQTCVFVCLLKDQKKKQILSADIENILPLVSEQFQKVTIKLL